MGKATDEKGSRMTTPRCLDIASACKALSVSRSTLYKLRNKKQLRIVKLLSKSVVPVEDIDRLIPAYAEPVGYEDQG